MRLWGQDLAARNVLVARLEPLRVLLSDFGLARAIPEEAAHQYYTQVRVLGLARRERKGVSMKGASALTRWPLGGWVSRNRKTPCRFAG